MLFLAIILVVPTIFAPCKGAPMAYTRLYNYGENLTLEQRLSDLGHCLRTRETPEFKVAEVEALYREVGGEADGWYLFRTVEILLNDFIKARFCVCRGAALSFGTERAKHCFSEDVETDVLLTACISRKPLEALELVVNNCDIPTQMDDKGCCRKDPE